MYRLKQQDVFFTRSLITCWVGPSTILFKLLPCSYYRTTLRPQAMHIDQQQLMVHKNLLAFL